MFIDVAAVLRDAIAQSGVQQQPQQQQVQTVLLPAAADVRPAFSDAVLTPSPRGRVLLSGSQRRLDSAPGFETVSLASVVPVGRA